MLPATTQHGAPSLHVARTPAAEAKEKERRQRTQDCGTADPLRMDIASALFLHKVWRRWDICTFSEFYQLTRFRHSVLCFGGRSQTRRKAPGSSPPRAEPARRPAPGVSPAGGGRAAAPRRHACAAATLAPSVRAASLPATGIGSFRPGKASWGLTILERESPILGMGKRPWKSWRALLVTESIGRPLTEGGPPAGRRGREPSSSCGTGEHWTVGAGRQDSCALSCCRPGIEVT